MYCSVCGGAVSPGLIYCNHCGARLGWAQGNEKASEPYPESLVWAMAVVFMAGIGCIIGIMAVMKNVLGFDKDFIAIVILLSFSLLFMVEGVFAWLLVSRNRKSLKKEEAQIKQLNEVVTKEFYTPPPMQSLAEPIIPSVTEHTTRTLEPVLREKKKE